MRVGKLILEEEIANTAFKKFRGLMFRKRLDRALLFVLGGETRAGAAIHSYFVFFPFDIIWLDKDKRIVDMKHVKPFQLLVMPSTPASYFIELPAGSIKKSGVRLGDKIVGI